jgi:hypothetical protein
VNANRLEIDCLAGYEITSGVSATRYDPAGTISRAQLAVFVANTATYAGLALDTTDPGTFLTGPQAEVEPA